MGAVICGEKFLQGGVAFHNREVGSQHAAVVREALEQGNDLRASFCPTDAQRQAVGETLSQNLVHHNSLQRGRIIPGQIGQSRGADAALDFGQISVECRVHSRQAGVPVLAPLRLAVRVVFDLEALINLPGGVGIHLSLSHLGMELFHWVAQAQFHPGFVDRTLLHADASRLHLAHCVGIAFGLNERFHSSGIAQTDPKMHLNRAPILRANDHVEAP